MKFTLAFLMGWAATAAAAEQLPVWFGTGADGIYAAALDGEKGTLTEARKAVEVASPGFLALDPERSLLFSVARPGKDEDYRGSYLCSYRITEEGGLTLVSKQESGGRGACHVDVTADGKVVLVAHYGGGSASSFRVGEGGVLSKAVSVHQHAGSSVHPSRQQAAHAHGFFAHPGGTMGYVPDLGIDEVVAYAIEPKTGATTRTGAWKMPPGTGPRHLKFGKDAKQVYVLGELNLTVVVGDLREGAVPEQKQVIGVLPEGADGTQMTCSEIRVHPNGRFVYTAARDLRGEGRDCLTVFKVLPGGQLELSQTVPAECDIPRNFNLDPTGRWLLVAGQKSNEVPIFQVGEDGGLSFTGRKIMVPTPMCVVFGK